MNRNDAKNIAKNITNEQLKQMFEVAKVEITDWTEVSNINKGITKGTSWNMHTRVFDEKVENDIIVITNMIREFGEFLPGELKPKPKNTKLKRLNNTPIHQEPIF